MKSNLRTALWLNMLLDVLPLGWLIYLTYVGASATNVPDAGLVVVVTVPLILIFAVDLAVLYGLGLRQRGQKVFLGYYAITRAIAVYSMYRILDGSALALQVVVPLLILALAIYTLRAVYSSLAKR